MTVDIHVLVDAHPGADIPGDILPQMAALATRIGVAVKTTVNGVTVLIYPGTAPGETAQAWRDAIQNGRAVVVLP